MQKGRRKIMNERETTCITFTLSEFQSLIKRVIGNDIDAEFNPKEGLKIYKHNEFADIALTSVYDALAKHIGFSEISEIYPRAVCTDAGEIDIDILIFGTKGREDELYRLLASDNDIVSWKIWRRGDIEGCLKEKGFKDSADNVNAVINTGILRALSECSDGDWETIYYAIRQANATGSLTSLNDQKATEKDKEMSIEDYFKKYDDGKPHFVRLIEMKKGNNPKLDEQNPPANTVGLIENVQNAPWGVQFGMKWSNGSHLALIPGDDKYVDIEALVEINGGSSVDEYLDYTIYDSEFNHIDGGQEDCVEIELIEDISEDLGIPTDSIMTSTEFDFSEYLY